RRSDDAGPVRADLGVRSVRCGGAVAVARAARAADRRGASGAARLERRTGTGFRLGGEVTAVRRHPAMPYGAHPDAVLMSRIAAGDVTALGVLYDRYAAQLVRFATRAAGPDEAEDIVHTTFLRVLRRASSFDPSAVSARPWLFAITAR